MNKKAQLDEFSIVGVIFGILGGLFSVIITNSMGGGLILKLMGFVITAIVCYFVGGKIAGG